MSHKATQILETAEKLFAAGRYHEVTLDDICHEAGVGKGTVYRYFEDKEDLYYQVILSGLDELAESVRRVGQEEEDPGEGLRRLARCMVEFFRKRKALFSLMWSAELRRSGRRPKVREQWRQKNEEVVAVAEAFLEKGMQQGIYDGFLSPRAAARLFVGMLRTGLRNREDMDGGKDWPMSVVNLVENGLRVRGDD